MILQGIWNRIAKKPYIFAIFSGGISVAQPGLVANPKMFFSSMPLWDYYIYISTQIAYAGQYHHRRNSHYAFTHLRIKIVQIQWKSYNVVISSSII